MKKLFTFFGLLLLSLAASAQTFTTGAFDVINLGNNQLLGQNDYNMATVAQTAGEVGCDITANGDGAFTVGLPGKTASGQHHLHIGSGGNWSNGDPSAITFFEVDQSDPLLLSAKKVESLKLGATYLIVSSMSDGQFALSGNLIETGSATKQRLTGVSIEEVEGQIQVERSEAYAQCLWKLGSASATENTTGLTEGTFLFRNLSGAADKYLGVDVNLSVVALEALTPSNAVTFSSPETGVFNLQLAGSARYVYCGSNGRFSSNEAANAIQLFKITSEDETSYTAIKVNEIEPGEMYLIVGTKNGANYALSSTLYQANSSDQRMEGTAVTIAEDKITVAKDMNLAWTIAQPSTSEISAFEPGVEGTFRPVNRQSTLVPGEEYMIYNAAVASNNACWGFAHEAEGIKITADADPVNFTTSDKSYLFMLKDNGDETYTIVNVGTGETIGTNYSITKWEESSAIRGGGAALRQDDGTVIPNGDFLGENVWVITDNSISGANRWNGNFWKVGDGEKQHEEVDLLLFGKGHPYAFYSVKEVSVDATVHFTVTDGETVLATLDLPYNVGTTVTEIPAELEKDYVTLEMPETLTVTEDETQNNVTIYASWDNLPFVPSTPEAPVYYYLNTMDGYYMVDLQANYIKVGGVYDEETWQTVPYEFEEVQALSEEDKVFYQFIFVGNPYTGFQIYSRGAEKYLTQNSAYPGFGTEAQAAFYDVLKQEGGFYIHRSGKLLGYNWGYLVWNTQLEEASDVNNLINATRVAATPAPVNVLVTYNVVDAEGNILATQQEELEEGTPISDIPEALKRPYTTYTYPSPAEITAVEGAEYTVTATFNYPFPVLTSAAEQDYKIVYLLTDNNMNAVACYGYPYIDEEAIGEEVEGDLTNLGNWFTYDETWRDAILSHAQTRPNALELYGLNFCLYGDYHFCIEGNPYEGFAIYATGDKAYFAADQEGNLNANWEDEESERLANATRFQINPTDQENVYTLTTDDGKFVVITEDTYEDENGDEQTERVLSLTDDATIAPSLFYILPRDLDKYQELIDNYLAAQEEINAIVGIEKVNADKADGSIYDLQGRRQNGLQRGLNIVNGKKVLVK